MSTPLTQPTIASTQSPAYAQASYSNDPVNTPNEGKKRDPSGKDKKRDPSGTEPELCSICADTYTAVIRRKITCTFCTKDACAKCIEHYLLSRPEDAHCIHCRVNYSDTVLKSICTKTYLQQTYYRHRQEVLVNRERANLPGLQAAAQSERRYRQRAAIMNQVRVEIERLKDVKRDMIIQISQLSARLREMTKAREGTKELYAEIVELVRKEKRMNQEIKDTRNTAWRQAMTETDDEKAEKEEKAEDEKEEKAEDDEKQRKKFIRRCMKPNCQGFLSTAWKCGICDHYSCSKCFTIKGPSHDSEHTCKKEDLDTADLIRKDSKPCPNCGEFINKISGCPQMYCISCHTPWDWDTGKIVTKGVIHNPHYYEWMKRTGGEMPRNPADVPCGGYPNGWELRAINRCASRPCAHYFYEFHRICMEIQEQSERQFRSHLDENGLRETHVRFLLGDFEERVWGQRLAQAEKKRKRDAEVQEVFAAFRMVAVELLNRIQHYRDETFDSFMILPPAKANAYLEQWNVEVQALIQMVNEGLKAISLSYGCQVPFIHIVAIVSHTSRTAQTAQHVQHAQHAQHAHSTQPISAAGDRWVMRNPSVAESMIYYRLQSKKWVGARRMSGTSHPVTNKEEKEEEEEEEDEDEEEEEEEEEEEDEEKEEEDAILRVALERSLTEK